MKIFLKKLFSIIALCTLFLPYSTHAQEVALPANPIEYQRAQVTQVLSQKEEADFGQEYTIQEVMITADGEVMGPITYEFLTQQKEQLLQEGEHVVLGRQIIQGEEVYFISDRYRINGIWWLLGILLFVTVLFAGISGLRSFIGLLLSIVVVAWYVVPQIMTGQSPFLVGIVTTLVLASTAIFLAHGVNKRTGVAFAGTMITILLAMVGSYLAVQSLSLFGVGTEEAFYLQFSSMGAVNLQGLLLAGILIGTLGILDDVTTAQAATVDELAKANKALSVIELYKRGLSVGREHIISLVNTLVLAYTGASLPLLLLFQIYERPLWVTLNSELIVEEIARMLVGSITLILAVPITTIIAAKVFGNKEIDAKG